MTAWDVFNDIAWISILLLVASFLRAKVKPIQALFLPASLMAGLMGLALGPNALGVIPFSETLSQYAGILIVVVFAALPFTSKVASLRSVIKSVGTTWSASQSIILFQYGLGLLFTLGVLSVVFADIPDGFGLMLAAGFMGGHGTAAGIAEVYGDYWEDAASIGMTAATVGILVAITGGILIIKWESMRGNTTYLADFKAVPHDVRSGLVAEKDRKPVGVSPVNTMSIDPLMYHAGLVFGVAGLAYLVAEWLDGFGDGYSVPVFPLGFLVGWAVLFVLLKFKAIKYFDSRLFERTSSSTTDLLVAFGIASIDPAIVVAYAQPLAMLLVFGLAVILSFYFFIAKRLFQDHPVEQSLFLWGWNTGTVPMGIALLRIVDPEMRSKTLDYYGIAYMVLSPAEVLLITLLPLLVMGGMAWPAALVLVATAIVIVVVARFTLSRKTPAPAEVPASAGS
ncbi:sodium/glutamate symporter [Nesterenkonia ebinurensis]|uniref:sodium/glutamate symporter n=1 Tax=Nesterenkonia ebinurensis TaxID=2608252 RepID=UPI00123CEF20|nr:sodium:glutamate symporter [Nesterenkonia ebinurensis]